MKPSLMEWDADPIKAFASFVVSPDFGRGGPYTTAREIQPLSASSAKSYCFRFNRFAKWFVEKNRKFSELSERDVDDFLSEVKCSDKVRAVKKREYMLLLSRSYEYLRVNPGFTGPRSSLWMQQNDEDETGAKALDADQVLRFLNALPSIDRPERQRKDEPRKWWKLRREHAMHATMLFAGLRISEAISLRLGQIDDPFEGRQEGPLVIVFSSDAKEMRGTGHEVLLRSYGALALRNWLDERAEMQIPGDVVFPSKLDGSQLDRSTVYRRLQATFDRAHIEVENGGGSSLRKTFALTERWTAAQTLS